MEVVNIWVLGSLLIFAILVFAIIIPVLIARWVFRINEQIDLLRQIKDELKKAKNLLIILGSCSPHWCNSSKTLEEAIKECEECDYDSSVADFSDDLIRYYSFETCMKAKGFIFIDEGSLPPDFRKAHVTRQSVVSFPLIPPPLT